MLFLDDDDNDNDDSVFASGFIIVHLAMLSMPGQSLPAFSLLAYFAYATLHLALNLLSGELYWHCFLQDFIYQYHFLLPNGRRSSRNDIVNFLHLLDLNQENYQIGATKVPNNSNQDF